MLIRIKSILNIFFYDLKYYFNTIFASFIYSINFKSRKKISIKEITLPINKTLLNSRAEYVLNGIDFFLGGSNGRINGVEHVPLSLIHLQYLPYFFIKPHRFNKYGDIKLVWDRYRGYHLPIIALQKPELLYGQINKYSSYFFLGYAWSSPMEVSFRVFNILISLSLLPKFLLNNIPKNIAYILYQHLSYLENNFEVDSNGHTNNHYLSNIIAAELLSQVLGVRKGLFRKSVMTELNKQFLSDGSNFEGSTSYHFLSTEIFFWFNILDQQESDGYSDLLSSAIGVCNLLTDSNGNIPYIGDNDSGVVVKLLVSLTRSYPPHSKFIFCEKAPSCIENLASYGERTAFFNRCINATPVVELKKNKGSVLNIDGLIKAGSFSFPFCSNFKVYYLEGLSLFVVKTMSQFLTVKCGPLGQLGRGGHDHHDQASFTFLDKTTDKSIRDNGTVSYSNFFSDSIKCRSVKNHNNFIDKRQELFDPTKPFTSIHPPATFRFDGCNLTVLVNYGEFKVARKFYFGSTLLIEDYAEEESEMVNLKMCDAPNFYTMYGVKA